MRKVFLRVFLIICFLIGFLAPIANNGFASQPASMEVTAGEEYTYEKIWVDGVLYVIVIDESGKILEIYPDPDCGLH
jgi:hypothetical protein